MAAKQLEAFPNERARAIFRSEDLVHFRKFFILKLTEILLTNSLQFHPEKNLTSVIDRYANEIRRVIGVIEYHLNKTGKEYLVGDKVCFADLMFLPWNNTALSGIMGEDFGKEWQEKYPKAWAWHQRLMARDAVRKTFDIKAKSMASGH